MNDFRSIGVINQERMPQIESWMQDALMIGGNFGARPPDIVRETTIECSGFGTQSSPCTQSKSKQPPILQYGGPKQANNRSSSFDSEAYMTKRTFASKGKKTLATKGVPTISKDQRRKAPSRAPWTRLQHEPPPQHNGTKNIPVSYNGILNPFKRELYRSLFGMKLDNSFREIQHSNNELPLLMLPHRQRSFLSPLYEEFHSKETRSELGDATQSSIARVNSEAKSSDLLPGTSDRNRILSDDPLKYDSAREDELDDPNYLRTHFDLCSSTENEERPQTPPGDLQRLISLSDSGIGVDDDLRSLSYGSLSTFSDEEDITDISDVASKEVLCGNRVSQMTRTYHDIEAVTRLLQEKEKDLELAARIGQQLLARNRGLEERSSSLETEISTLNDQITQLRHDLQMKTELLHIYTNDLDESSTENTPTGCRPINVDFLERRVVNLEDENKGLRQEASQLAFDTQDCENREKELVHDVIKQLSDANLHVHQLSDELAKKVEDSLRQQEEITQLLAQVVNLHSRNKRFAIENDELSSMVGVARECQQELTTELAGLKEKYAEVLDLLHDTQEQLRRAHKKHLPGSRGSHLGSFFSSPFDSGNDSIASELHSLTSSLSDSDRPDGAKALNRVFDTVRLSSRLSGSIAGMGSLQSTPTKQANLTPSYMSGPYQMTDSRSFGGYSPYYSSISSSHMSGSSGLPSLDSGADSDASFHTDSEDNYPASRPGVPGWPGTPDLDKCLRRLGPNERPGLPGSFLPYGCRTPDSIMSTGGSGRSGGGYSGIDWKLPQKLQIVKPIEGSLTLHQWSRLATPHLGGLLEEREGVAIKGATNNHLNLEVYSMSDLEEDDPEDAKAEFPGKQFMYTSGINTYTNSTVLHPDEVTNLTSTLQHTHSSVLQSSSAPASATPVHGASVPSSRRGSTVTFTTNVGLAKQLNERGFVNALDDMLPTATPANSPDSSRPGSPGPSRYKLPGFEDLTKTFYSGASFLRKTFYKDEPSAPSSPEGPKINLVAKVQAIGVDRFVGPGGSIKTVGGIVTARTEVPSPLLHLSNLIRSGANKKPHDTTTTSGPTTPNDSASVAPGGIMAAPKISSPGERRPKVPFGAPMGIPGRPGSTQLDSRLKQLKPGQRADLGTVGKIESRPRALNLGQVPGKRPDEKMGTIGWTSFGRKGGLL